MQCGQCSQDTSQEGVVDIDSDDERTKIVNPASRKRVREDDRDLRRREGRMSERVQGQGRNDETSSSVAGVYVKKTCIQASKGSEEGSCRVGGPRRRKWW